MASPAIGSVATKGVSSSTKSTLATARTHFDGGFRAIPAIAAKYPRKWDSCLESELTTLMTYAEYAHYLIYAHKTRSQDMLSAQTSQSFFRAYFVQRTHDPTRHQPLAVINYSSALLVDAKNRLSASPSAQTVEFFKCLVYENKTPGSEQWARIKANITRIVANIDLANGSLDEGGANALYSDGVEAIISAYAREGSPESLSKKFEVDFGWLSAGRGGEMSTIMWEGLRVRTRVILWMQIFICSVPLFSFFLASQWDPFFEVVHSNALQRKVSAVKQVAFSAGANPQICFFTNLGDFLVAGPRILPFSPDSPNYIFPQWQAAESPTTRLSNVIKAVLEGGSFRIRATGVRGDYTAASLRVGVVNYLTAYMPAEFVAYLTGHQLTGIGALFEYLRVEVSRFQFYRSNPAHTPMSLPLHSSRRSPSSCLA